MAAVDAFDVASDIEFSQRALSAIEPGGTGWVVTNPPYGKRIHSSHDLRDLYAQIGNVLREKCPGWQAGILCSDDYLLGHTGLPLDQRFALDNGGVSVKLALGKVPVQGDKA